MKVRSFTYADLIDSLFTYARTECQPGSREERAACALIDLIVADWFPQYVNQAKLVPTDPL